MNRFDEIIDNDELKWTKDELGVWLDGLDEHKRNLVVEMIQRAKNDGINTHRFACKARERMEGIDAKHKMSAIDWIASATEGWFIGSVISGSRKIT